MAPLRGETVNDTPETKYVRSGDYHIAYQTLGEGPLDIVYIGSWWTNVEAPWEFPPLAESMRRLASLGRLILFDKRGVGLSDPVPLKSLPPLEEWMDDLRSVLDEVGSERASLIGQLDAGPMAILFASSFPERTNALVLSDSYARLARAFDYPAGIPERLHEPFITYVEGAWGRVGLEAIAGGAVDASLSEAQAWYLRQSASPGVAAAMFRMLLRVDLRHLLPSIQVPTLIIQRKEGPYIRVGHGRYLAEHIPGARYVELPGSNQVFWTADDRNEIIDEIEEFITGARPVHAPDRVLATVLFTDIVGSTKRAADIGDRKWREVLARHRDVVRRQLDRFRGREVMTTGDGFLATFDGPARAIQCASAIVQATRQIGVNVRAGVHTGEIELMGEDVGGIAVHIAARVMAEARAGEVLVSSGVPPLVAGSGLEFDDRGERDLKGVPGRWRLYAVKA